ncbi:MAG: hypothetical protein ABH805_01705 [Candidatus Nealsonbacteria bacterium]
MVFIINRDFAPLTRLKNVIGVWNKREIRRTYGKRRYKLIKALARTVKENEEISFLILFRDKGENSQKMTWYSPKSDAVVINLNFNPVGAHFEKELKQVLIAYNNVGLGSSLV